MDKVTEDEIKRLQKCEKILLEIKADLEGMQYSGNPVYWSVRRIMQKRIKDIEDQIK